MTSVSVSLDRLARRRTVVRALRAARRCGDSGAALQELSPHQRARVTTALARAEARAAWPLPWALERRLPSPGARGNELPRVELEAHLHEAAGAVERLSPDPVALGVAAELLDMLSTLENHAAEFEFCTPLPSRRDPVKIVGGLPARG